MFFLQGDGRREKLLGLAKEKSRSYTLPLLGR
jgi:hypothetical protein